MVLVPESQALTADRVPQSLRPPDTTPETGPLEVTRTHTWTGHCPGVGGCGGVGRTLLGLALHASLLGRRSVNCTRGAKPQALGARREPQKSKVPHTEPPGAGSAPGPPHRPGRALRTRPATGRVTTCELGKPAAAPVPAPAGRWGGKFRISFNCAARGDLEGKTLAFVSDFHTFPSSSRRPRGPPAAAGKALLTPALTTAGPGGLLSAG